MRIRMHYTAWQGTVPEIRLSDGRLPKNHGPIGDPCIAPIQWGDSLSRKT